MMKENDLKKFVSALLTILVLSSFSMCLFAIPTDAVTPRWVSIFSIDVSMAFDGVEGEVSGIASKKSTASRIEGTLYLYKLVGDDWIYIDEWYGSKSIGTLAVSGTFDCESEVTYKAVFVVTAYTDNTPESETYEYIKQCP